MSTPSKSPGDKLFIYPSPRGEIRADVRLDHKTVWLAQEQMGQLFGRERSVIAKHVGNVFREGELESAAASAKFAHVQFEGERTKISETDHLQKLSDNILQDPSSASIA